MNKIMTTEDFKEFLDANRDKVNEKVVNIEEIPLDDDWSLEDDWDEEYAKELSKRSKV